MTTQERIDELKQCPAWETHVSSLEALALQLQSDLCRLRELLNRAMAICEHRDCTSSVSELRNEIQKLKEAP